MRSGRRVDDAWVAGEDNGVAEVLSRTGGVGAERISVAAPAKPAQQAALEMAAKRAKVVYFAGLPKHDPVSPLDMNQLHYKELAMLGAYGATHRQYRITMDYLDRKQDELAKVVTHRFAAREDRRGVRDDPGRHRAEDGRHAVSRRPYVIGCDVGSQGTNAALYVGRRRARRLRVRGLRPLVPAPGVGGAGPRPLDGRDGDGVPASWSPRCPEGRPRSGVCRSDRSSTGWSCATRRARRLRPALIWMDRRAEAQAAALAERISPETSTVRVGANLDSSHAVFKALWIRDEEPERLANAAHAACRPAHTCCGTRPASSAVDPSNASSLALLDPRTKAWSARGVGRDRDRSGDAPRARATRRRRSGP